MEDESMAAPRPLTKRVPALELRKALRSDRTLSHIAWATAHAVLDHMNKEGTKCFVSIERLAEEARLGKSTVGKGIAELRRAGFLATPEYLRLGRDGKSTVVRERKPWRPRSGPGAGWVLSIEATLPNGDVRSEPFRSDVNTSETSHETTQSEGEGEYTFGGAFQAPPPEGERSRALEARRDFSSQAATLSSHARSSHMHIDAREELAPDDRSNQDHASAALEAPPTGFSHDLPLEEEEPEAVAEGESEDGTNACDDRHNMAFMAITAPLQLELDPRARLTPQEWLRRKLAVDDRRRSGEIGLGDVCRELLAANQYEVELLLELPAWRLLDVLFNHNTFTEARRKTLPDLVEAALDRRARAATDVAPAAARDEVPF